MEVRMATKSSNNAKEEMRKVAQKIAKMTDKEIQDMFGPLIPISKRNLPAIAKEIRAQFKEVLES